MIKDIIKIIQDKAERGELSLVESDEMINYLLELESLKNRVSDIYTESNLFDF